MSQPPGESQFGPAVGPPDGSEPDPNSNSTAGGWQQPAYPQDQYAQGQYTQGQYAQNQYVHNQYPQSGHQPGPYPANPSGGPGGQQVGQPLVPRRLKPPATPLRPASYYQFLRTPRLRWWRPLIVLLLMGVGVALAQILALIPLAFESALGSAPSIDATSGEVTNMTPLLLLCTNLGLAACIPIGLLAEKAGYGSAGRWLHSVQRRFRWKWFAISFAVMALFYLAQTVVEFVIAPEAPKPDPQWLAYLFVVLLTTPFQCAGEEYLARGVIGRAVAAWFGNEWAALIVGTIFSASVFMWLHASSDVWMNLSYFSWAAVLSVACWLFGGLETAVAAHIVNNFIAFGLSVFFGGMDTVMERDSGSGSPLMLMMTVVVALAVLVLWKLFGRSGLSRLSDVAPSKLTYR